SRVLSSVHSRFEPSHEMPRVRARSCGFPLANAKESIRRRMDAQTVRRYRPRRMTAPLFSVEPSSPWLWDSLAAIMLVLVALNVLLIVFVHGRRIRQSVRGGRERRFQAQLEQVMAKLGPPT